jgi:hypothetical protein
MALPEIHPIPQKNQTRSGSVNAARKGSPQEAYLSPIGEGETPGEDDSPSKRYEEAAILLRSPQPKAVMSYKPPSEAADRNLRRIMYHCG